MMSQEEYGAVGEVLEGTELDAAAEPGTVPVVSKETEVLIDECYLGEQQLKQGEAELSETLVIKESLEAYLNLIQSAGALGLTPESTKILKVGLEHIDRAGISSALSLGMESLDTNNRFVLSDNVSLEEGFKSYLKGALERIRKIIDWLVDKYHQLYTRYSEGINKLSNQLKVIEKQFPKMKEKSGLTFKIDNAQELMVDDELDLNNLGPIASLADFVAVAFPKTATEVTNEIAKAFDDLKHSDDWSDDDTDELLTTAFIALTKTGSGHPAFRRSTTFPGNYELVFKADKEAGDSYKMEPMGDKVKEPISKEVVVQSPNSIKARHEVLTNIVGLMDKAASGNLEFNRALKRVNQKASELSKIIQNNSDIDDSEKERRMKMVTTCIIQFKTNTPSMLSVLRYLVSYLNSVIAILHQETKMLVSE